GVPSDAAPPADRPPGPAPRRRRRGPRRAARPVAHPPQHPGPVAPRLRHGGRLGPTAVSRLVPADHSASPDPTRTLSRRDAPGLAQEPNPVADLHQGGPMSSFRHVRRVICSAVQMLLVAIAVTSATVSVTGAASGPAPGAPGVHCADPTGSED